MFLSLAVALVSPSIQLREVRPIEDTYIDAQLPDSNFGRDGLLLGGPGSAILIRFPELDWANPDSEVEAATLTFTMTEAYTPKLKGVSRILSTWMEGSDLRLPNMRAASPDPQYRGGATWARRRYGLTGPKWASAGATGTADSQLVPGVTMTTEGNTVTLSGLAQVMNEMARNPMQNHGLRIEFESKSSFFSSEGYGVAPRLSLSWKRVERTGPRLAVLSLEPKGEAGKASGWIAKVKNIGDAVVTGVNARWSLRGEQKAASDIQQALAPGDVVQMEWDISTAAEKASPDVSALSVEVTPGGTGGPVQPQAQLQVPITGLPVNLEVDEETRKLFDAERGSEPMERYLGRLVTFINSGVFAQSRTIFATEGCRERLRLAQGDPAAAKIELKLTSANSEALFASASRQVLRALSPYKGLWLTPPDSSPTSTQTYGWLPDTRDDSGWPQSLMLPMYPWGEPKPLQAPLPSRGLLSRAEIAAFNEMAGKPFGDRAGYVPGLPTATILSFADSSGAPLYGATIEAYRTSGGKLSSTAVFKGVTTSGGKVFAAQSDGKSIFADLAPDGSNSWILLRVTRDFVTETAWLPAHSLATEYARGNANVPVIELRVMMPSGVVRTDEDLAQGKTVTDSLGRFPAELNAVVDNKPDTFVAMQAADKPYWIDIDLGRDRLIGAIEIETVGAVNERFEITTLKTGQKPVDAQMWVKEVAGALRFSEKGTAVGSNHVIQYTSTAVRARSVRVTYPAGSEAKIAAIRVRTLQQEN